MNRQTASRVNGERRAQMTLIRLLCAVSVWRTAMTRLLPLAGASAWWVLLLCLLPGLLAAALLRFVMFLTRSTTVMEALRACLGRGGAMLLSAALTVPLLVEGISSITALITLFTEGVGTRGTQLTLAILTGVALLFSLHREGLARGAYFLHWVMAAAGVTVAAFLLADAKPDHLFPLYGDGRASASAAILSGISLAWPVALLLTVEPAAGQGRMYGALVPTFAAAAAVLVTTLAVPHELLVRQEGLAGMLLLPTRYMPNALRVLALCLMMLAFFLAIGASAQLATTQLFAAAKQAPGWLPYALLAGLFLTQAGDASRLWALLGMLEPWLLAPLTLLTAVCLPIALYRRKRP